MLGLPPEFLSFNQQRNYGSPTGDLVRQRFKADGNTDISGFNDVLKKPFNQFQEFKNSPKAEIFF